MLNQPVTVGSLSLRNRAILAPMCQYALTAQDGVVRDWHLMHLGARAAGGFGLVIAEATGICPEARISPYCPGLWNDEQIAAWTRVVEAVHAQGAAAGIQLNHAGAKASGVPWLQNMEAAFPETDRQTVTSAEGWTPLAPSSGVGDLLSTAEPQELVEEQILASLEDWAAAARRAAEAGFDVVQIHAAHGYLIHQFLSPQTNRRTDRWGGDFEGRTRYLREVVAAVRKALPESVELMVRISGTDWASADPDDGAGWTLSETVRVSRLLLEAGVSMLECSSAGIGAYHGPRGSGYQAPLALAVKRAVPGLFVSAVGSLDDPKAAEGWLEKGLDGVSIGRAALRNPQWPVAAAVELEDGTPPIAPSYWRAGFENSH